MVDPELRKYLSKVSRIFDVDSLLSEDVDQNVIIDYYTQSNKGYRVFHSTDGSVHMALNFDGKFDKEGYYGQAKIVQNYIDKLGPARVLELASGQGFNLIHLAKNNREVQFVGIDITPIHVREAVTKSNGLPNTDFKIGDFQQLPFSSESFDMVFVIESICHATDMKLALHEVYRVLKPGGYFIVIDGFRKPDFGQLDKDVQLAAALTEVSMAVGRAWIIDEWLKLAQDVDFHLIKLEDISYAIMPNLLKFQYLARGYFKYPALSRIFLKALPPRLVKNAIAGLLMPFTVRAGAQGYYIVTLERPPKDGDPLTDVV
jgi:ubiquinone/menaquinone biosynthesis C-methylase UbiE